MDVPNHPKLVICSYFIFNYHIQALHTLIPSSFPSEGSSLHCYYVHFKITRKHFQHIFARNWPLHNTSIYWYFGLLYTVTHRQRCDCPPPESLHHHLVKIEGLFVWPSARSCWQQRLFWGPSRGWRSCSHPLGEIRSSQAISLTTGNNHLLSGLIRVLGACPGLWAMKEHPMRPPPPLPSPKSPWEVQFSGMCLLEIIEGLPFPLELSLSFSYLYLLCSIVLGYQGHASFYHSASIWKEEPVSMGLLFTILYRRSCHDVRAFSQLVQIG